MTSVSLEIRKPDPAPSGAGAQRILTTRLRLSIEPRGVPVNQVEFGIQSCPGAPGCYVEELPAHTVPVPSSCCWVLPALPEHVRLRVSVLGVTRHMDIPPHVWRPSAGPATPQT